MTGDEYDIRDVSGEPSELISTHRLLRDVFPRARHLTVAYLDWLYNANPAGHAVGFNAWSAGTLAAHYVTVPVIAELEGAPVRGLLSLNTATHPAHQGKRLFTRLATQTYACAASRGFTFAYGVANANSTPGFTRYLGFRVVAPLDAKVGIGTPLRRAGQPKPLFVRTWDRPSLSWRLSNPSARYGLGGADCKHVFASTGIPFFRALLADLEGGARDAIDAGRRRAAPGATLYLGLDPSIDWRSSWFWDIPRAVRPSPLNLIFRRLDGGASDFDASAVLVRALDFDAY